MLTAMLCGVKMSVNYTRCTLPDFNARAETQTFLGSPSTKIVTFCRLAPKRRFVLFIALERELPDLALRPVTKHTLAIVFPPLFLQELLSLLFHTEIMYHKWSNLASANSKFTTDICI